MKKKNDIILICVLCILFLLLIVGIIYEKLNNNDKNNNNNISEDIIPEIKEEYKLVTLNELKNYYNNNVYLNEENDIISEEKDGYYIIGTYGKLYTNPIYIEDKNETNNFQYTKCNNYIIYFENDLTNDKYFINLKNNEKSNTYKDILPIYSDINKNTCRYMILVENNNALNKYTIYDSINNSYTSLNDDVNQIKTDTIINKEMYTLNNKNQLVTCTYNNLCNVIDFNNNATFKDKYSDIKIYNENEYIAKYNGKYGIIDNEDKVLLKFEYDNIEIFNKYIIVTKENKLGVLDKNYNIIVNYSIEYEKGNNIAYYAKEINGYLNIQTFSNEDPLCYTFVSEDKYNKYYYLYLIDTNGIYKKIKGTSNIFNDNYYEKEYECIINKNHNILTYTFYDRRYNLKVIYNSEALHKELEFKGSFTFINRNYYSLSIDYKYDGNEKINSDIVYVDIEKKNSIDEIDTKYYYFDNGYGFSITNKLNIYKKKKLIDSFNIKECTYIGNYMFIVNIDNEYKIIKVEFKKES